MNSISLRRMLKKAAMATRPEREREKSCCWLSEGTTRQREVSIGEPVAAISMSLRWRARNDAAVTRCRCLLLHSPRCDCSAPLLLLLRSFRRDPSEAASACPPH